MQTIRIMNLREGDCFEQALFLPSGQKLLTPGVTITQRHLQLLSRQSVPELILADSLDELAEAGLLSRYDMKRLSVGQVAEQDLIAPGGGLLVEAGEQIEDHHVASMAGGGFVSAADTPADEARARKDRMLMAELAVEQLEEHMASIPLRVRPQEMEIWDVHKPSGEAWPEAASVSTKREYTVGELRKLYTSIGAGQTVHVRQFIELVDDMLRDLLDHRQRFCQLALMCKRREDYMPEHAYTVSVLAMATAAQMTWSLEQIKLMGIAGMLFDLGMLLVPRRIRVGGCELTEIDRNLVQRHPVFGLIQIQNIEGVPPVLRLMAYQHHERENGSGYPCGLRGDRICDFSRVLSVADVFAALTSPRHYRKGNLPYMAMEQMVRSAASNTFYKPAVRALVQAAGLFPVGSFVKLSNSKLAHVVACNPNHLDRPIVQVIEPDGSPSGQAIDLSRVPAGTLSVVRPVPGPTEREHNELLV
jgi:HD-GYP domain-containing protein (c-di-GMP phosphodiesterase class II)